MTMIQAALNLEKLNPTRNPQQVSADSTATTWEMDTEIPAWVYRRFGPEDRECDEDLVHRVVAQLRMRLGNPIYALKLRVHPDGVVVQGHVRSYYSKQLVQEIVREVSGLRVLSNDIEVHCVDVR